jgi:hypothetical protein
MHTAIETAVCIRQLVHVQCMSAYSIYADLSHASFQLSKLCTSQYMYEVLSFPSFLPGALDLMPCPGSAL